MFVISEPTALSASAAALRGSTLFAASAAAPPVQWSAASGGNDHGYEYVAATLTWSDASTAAAASSWLGLNGHLVTITSAAEQAFLLDLAGDGQTGASDAQLEGQRVWTSGPEAGQQFWAGTRSAAVSAAFSPAGTAVSRTTSMTQATPV